jgi:hypothetical protein
MLSTAVELLGFAMLSAAAWLAIDLWAALLVAGAALVLIANFELGKQKVRRIRVLQGPLTNGAVDELAPDVALTNGAIDQD